MKNSKKIVSILALGLVFAACSQKEEAKPSKEETKLEAPAETEEAKDEKEAPAEEAKDAASEEVSLADWEGKWNNMGAYLDKPEVAEAFKTLAEKENTSEEEAKKAYEEKRACDFDGLEISGDTVKFLDGFPEDGGKVKAEGTYKFIEKQEVEHGSSKMELDIFEAEGDAPYKYLLMMPIHGEESLTHYHMRYGDDKDELLAKEGWYPTFVKPSTTDGQIIDEITE